MTPSALGLLALAWLLTYLIHSTLLLGGTWLLLALRAFPNRWEDRLWKVALLGGLVTATAQIGAGLEPFGGRVRLGNAAPAAALASALPEQPSADPRELSEQLIEPTPPPARAEGRVPFLDGGGSPSGRAEAARPYPRMLWPLSAWLGAWASASREREEDRHPVLLRERRAVEPAAAASILPPAPASTPAAVNPPAAEPTIHRTKSGAWRSWLAAAWSFGAAASLVALAGAIVRLRRRLRGRVELQSGPLRKLLDELTERAGARARIRLTVSPRITAPVTLGIVRGEICVPVRALTDLSLAQQEAMLGHELGHAIRRDAAWLGLCGLLETLFFLQPLNRVGRQRLQRAAELLCDDWAVHLTGRSLSLASCLTEVAQWVVTTRKALPAPGMTGAPLTQRVERLLGPCTPEVVRRDRWWLPSAAAGLVVVALAAPGFTAALGLQDAKEQEPVATPSNATPELLAAPIADPCEAPTPSDAPCATAEPARAPSEAPCATPEPAPAPATAPHPIAHRIAGVMAVLDAEFAAAESDLDDLRAELSELGALDRFSEQLSRLEQEVRELAAARARLDSKLRGVLRAQRASPDSAPPPSCPSPSAPSPDPRGVTSR